MHRSPHRLLVVDDDPALARTLRRAFGVEGYDVQCAGDGAEALVRLSGGSFDAVVLDVSMPRLDGLAVCRRMRERRDQDAHAPQHQGDASEMRHDDSSAAYGSRQLRRLSGRVFAWFCTAPLQKTRLALPPTRSASAELPASNAPVMFLLPVGSKNSCGFAL